MTTSAIAAFGAVLKRNGNTIAELYNIGGLQVSRDMIEATSHASSDTYKEFIPGLKDGGEVPIEGNFIPSDTNGQIGLLTDYEAGTLQSFVITGPTAGAFTWTFSAYVTKFKTGDLTPDGKTTFTATLRVSGKPTLAVTISDDLTNLTGVEENGGAALTFTPTFDGSVYVYNITINTASTYIKLTPTLSGATITIRTATASQTVASGAESGTIAVTDGEITDVYLDVKETGKVAKTYTLHVYTP